MDYFGEVRVKRYVLDERLQELLKKKFASKIEAKIALSEFWIMADAMGHRGQYRNLAVMRNRIRIVAK